MTHLAIGDASPQFSSVDQNGSIQSSEKYKGKKMVVFFYPKANTPGCTAEACDLRDNFERFEAQNYVLLGVSADSVILQKSLVTNLTSLFRYLLMKINQ